MQRSLFLCVIGACMTTVCMPAAVAQCEFERLSAFDGMLGDRFGGSAAMHEDVVVVGARSDGPGSAYVFRFDPFSTEWIHEQKLIPSSGASFQFGRSVGIDRVAGALVIVSGAVQDSEAAASAGAAYVFRYDIAHGQWIEEQKLIASDATAGALFGVSVAMLGDLLVVGAFGEQAAYVFRYDPEEKLWIEVSKLVAFDAAEGEKFGFSVAIDENLIVVGATDDNDAGEDSGSAYIFRSLGPTGPWVHEQKLVASDVAELSRFGYSVAISSDLVLVGAIEHDDKEIDAGAAYVFRYRPRIGEWEEEQRLTASDSAAFDNFGFAVSIRADIAIVSSPFKIGVAPATGAAYVFEYEERAQIWTEHTQLTAPDPGVNDSFGTSVALEADVLMIGAGGENGSRGAGYLFALGSDCNLEYCGDGRVAGLEGCDDGNLAGGDGCSPGCSVEAGFVCSVDPGTCEELCPGGFVGGTEECGLNCTNPSVCSTECGDGLIAGIEECDDGNTQGYDGCSPSCVVEAGFACSDEPSVCVETCGDGVIVGGETCDDGNKEDGDGCSSRCYIEDGFACSGEPSICILALPAISGLGMLLLIGGLLAGVLVLSRFPTRDITECCGFER